MTTTFGRRVSNPSVRSPPPAPALDPAPVDPRLQALAQSVREADPSHAELKAYLSRRRAAIGPWTWVANLSAIAAPVVTYVLHAPLALVLGVAVVSTASRTLLKRGRLRWAAEIEAGARARRYDGADDHQG